MRDGRVAAAEHILQKQWHRDAALRQRTPSDHAWSGSLGLAFKLV